MATTENKLLTVEEYAKIKDPPSGRYELHHGELVLVPPPTNEHVYIQTQILLILSRICIGWYVTMEFPFRPLPEYEVWRADVGMVTKQRFRTSPRKGWLEGSPDLVVDVLSPSNTVQALYERERICFEGGCSEFWIVDPDSKTIRARTPDGAEHEYTVDDEIPLDRFSPGKLAVAEVFAD